MNGSFMNQFSLLGPGNKLSDRITETATVSPHEIRDVFDMIRLTPTISTSLEIQQNDLFSRPFEIVFGSLEQNKTAPAEVDWSTLLRLKPELQATLIEKKFMPWVPIVHSNLAATGYCPYYFEEIVLSVE